MINHDLYIKSLKEKIKEPITIEDEFELYQDWVQLSNIQLEFYKYRFSNYIQKEYYKRFMNHFFILVNHLQKHFSDIFQFYFHHSFKNSFYYLREYYKELIENQEFFTPFDIYKFDFLSLQYNRLKERIKNFQKKEKELYFLIFYKGNLLNQIHYHDIRYLIYKFLK